MPKNPIGQVAKNSTLTFRLPERLKRQAERQAERKNFRSTGDYVNALIAQDLEKKAA